MSQFKDQEKELVAPPKLKVSEAQPAPPPFEFVPPPIEEGYVNGEHWYDRRERLRQEALDKYRAQHGDEAYHLAIKHYKSPYEEAIEASNKSWQGVNQFLDIISNVAGFALAAGVIIVGLIAFATINAQSNAPPPDLEWSLKPFFEFFNMLFEGHDFKGASDMNQVLNLLPFAAFGCALTTALATYIARSAKSREIDWTDSHLMLEYSGPINLAFKWTAIKSVDQIYRWDIFHGRQPVFLLTTQEGTSSGSSFPIFLQRTTSAVFSAS